MKADILNLIPLFYVIGIPYKFFSENKTEDKTDNNPQKELETITDGHLRCNTSNSTDTLKIDYTQNFKFEDSAIVSYKYEEVSTGTREEINEYENNTTIEGLYTLQSIYKLLKDKKVEMPIIDLIYDIIDNKKSIEELPKFLINKK